MEVGILIFLSSGLFLGWSLGANDAANVFGTAVGTRMLRFGTAAIIASLFIILGAVISGSGAAHTLGKLGAINAIGGSFIAAFSAALTVYLMTKAGVPVSTSQAIVGAIIGWNLYSGFPTDGNALLKIMMTWVACPILAALIAIPLYKGVQLLLKLNEIHILRLDAYTRLGLILAGAFGSYALGANNIANVMGVFLSANPFNDLSLGGVLEISGIQQLFLLGALAIAVGVFTYSRRVMMTVGGGLMPLSPVGAWVVVVSHSIVLFLFASKSLEHTLASWGLPTIPLVPVSSSQAVIGAVIGIGLLKGGRGIRWSVLLKISSGWVTTPIISGLVSFIALFFLQNVFQQEVYKEKSYLISAEVLEQLKREGQEFAVLTKMKDHPYTSVRSLRKALASVGIKGDQEQEVLRLSQLEEIKINPDCVVKIDEQLNRVQREAVERLQGRHYRYTWSLDRDLAEQSESWRSLPAEPINHRHNNRLKSLRAQLHRSCRLVEPRPERL